MACSKREVKPIDFLRYIEYETKLEKLRKVRAGRVSSSIPSSTPRVPRLTAAPSLSKKRGSDSQDAVGPLDRSARHAPPPPLDASFPVFAHTLGRLALARALAIVASARLAHALVRDRDAPDPRQVLAPRLALGV